MFVIGYKDCGSTFLTFKTDKPIGLENVERKYQPRGSNEVLIFNVFVRGRVNQKGTTY